MRSSKQRASSLVNSSTSTPAPRTTWTSLDLSAALGLADPPGLGLAGIVGVLPARFRPPQSVARSGPWVRARATVPRGNAAQPLFGAASEELVGSVCWAPRRLGTVATAAKRTEGALKRLTKLSMTVGDGERGTGVEDSPSRHDNRPPSHRRSSPVQPATAVPTWPLQVGAAAKLRNQS